MFKEGPHGAGKGSQCVKILLMPLPLSRNWQGGPSENQISVVNELSQLHKMNNELSNYQVSPHVCMKSGRQDKFQSLVCTSIFSEYDLWELVPRSLYALVKMSFWSEQVGTMERDNLLKHKSREQRIWNVKTMSHMKAYCLEE